MPRVTPHGELPGDAPELRVSVSDRLGGAAIRAADPATDGHRLSGWATA